MYIVWLAAIAAAMFFGFCAGRMFGGDDGAGARTVRENRIGVRLDREEGAFLWRRAGTVGSPVSGKVEDMRDGERPIVIIRPSEDRLYAPVSGKVTRLLPPGNAFLFQADFGAELHIWVGEGDELLGRFYRPRIVQNEIVGKGKLLLEFDRRGLETAGASSLVSVAVEAGEYGSDVLAAVGEPIKTGEEIVRVHP